LIRSRVKRIRHKRPTPASGCLHLFRFASLRSPLTAQAIADRVLVDLTPIALEAGFRFPLAAAAAAIETIPQQYSHEDIEGRLWDVVRMASLAARRTKPGCARIAFEVILHIEGTRRQYQTLILDIGPGDTPESVITIGFPADFRFQPPHNWQGKPGWLLSFPHVSCYFTICEHSPPFSSSWKKPWPGRKGSTPLAIHSG
jgi:hypothetical protein